MGCIIFVCLISGDILLLKQVSNSLCNIGCNYGILIIDSGYCLHQLLHPSVAALLLIAIPPSSASHVPRIGAGPGFVMNTVRLVALHDIRVQFEVETCQNLCVFW